MYYKKNEDGTCTILESLPDDDYYKDFEYIEDDMLEICVDGWRIKNDLTGRTEKFYNDQAKLEATTLCTQLKQRLFKTDWIITKLAELKVTDEEAFELAKEKYSTILDERASIRKQISDILDNYPELNQ